MTELRIKRGLQTNLPASADNSILFFATDTGRLYQGGGTGNPLIKYNDVGYGPTLPQNGVEGKLFLVEDGANSLRLYGFRNNTWVDLSAEGGGGGIDPNLLSLILGLESKTDTFSYNVNGDIAAISTQYANTELDDENTTYTYDNNGNIIKEEITKLNKKITNTFTYDNSENITKIDTVVVDV